MDVSFTNVLEGARQYFQGLPLANTTAGPYYQQNGQPDRQQQNQQNQQQQQQHHQQQQTYYQQSSDHYAVSPAVHSGNANQWIQQQPSPSEGNRTPSRERTPVQQRPSSHSSAGSRPPSHSSQYQEVPRQYQSTAYPQHSQEHQTVSHQSTFQFTRPQSREQSHPNQPYHQHPGIATSTYQPQATPHLSRTSSREQLAPAAPVYKSAPIPSQSHQYSYQQPRSYYTTPQEPVMTTQATQPQVQQPYYSKQVNAPMKPRNYMGDNRLVDGGSTSNNSEQYQVPRSNEQTMYRATHNLPPIAAVSSYHSTKAANANPPKNVVPRPKVPYSNSYPLQSATQSTIQYTNKRSDSYVPPTSNSFTTTYNHLQGNNNYNQNQISTVITQSYTNVIMTTTNSNSLSSNQNRVNYQNLQPSQSNQNAVYHQSRKPSPINNSLNSASVIKQRKESPLDLSVKTVRTSADSTESEKNKYAQTKHPGTLSNHNYPTLDVRSMERSFTQRSQPTATAPKVEFHPNFNLSSSARSWNAASKANEIPKPYHENPAFRGVSDYAMKPQIDSRNRYSLPTIQNHRQYNIPPQNDALTAKRPSQLESPAIPNKIAKVENWRESIDLQIEEKLSNYKQQQLQIQSQQHQQQQQQRSKSVLQHSKTSIEPSMNGNIPRSSGSSYNYYQKPPYVTTQAQPSYIQSYVSTPTSEHNNYPPGYCNPYHKQSQHLYINPAANRFNPATCIPTKSNSTTGADKQRVLSILRNSIENKEQKKIEQQKSQDINQMSDVQHPNTDVTAPLQPKPGIDRNNVSPFTPISVPDPNICKMPPKVVSAEMKPIDDSTVIGNNNANNPYYDGLAAFLEARIRTKGELKELNQNAARDARIQAFLEDAIKSPNRQNMLVSPSPNSGPPKLIKEKPGGVYPPRKKLFSRNEDGSIQPSMREKSSMRSSSETSVFDFPDSDDENEMPVLERQTLESMRKDRRNSLKAHQDIDVKPEVVDLRPPSPDDIFGDICDKFVEQLKSKPSRRIRRSSARDLCKTEQEQEVKVKIEVVEDEEPLEPRPVDVATANEFEAKNSVTPVTKNVIQSDSDLSDSEIKTSGCVIVRNKHRVRRKIVSSSDSSDNEERLVVVKVEKPESGSTKPEEEKSKIIVAPETPVVKPEVEVAKDDKETPSKSAEVVAIIRPAKKPLFGDGSDFYPGWEEGVYNYKRSLRMPPSLIQLTRPPNRKSTSLPDLDPCPQSPTTSIITEESKDSTAFSKKTFKPEPPDSDNESTSSFNVFSRKTNYDSEGSSSITSLPNTRKENISILDKLLEKCGDRKKRKQKRKDDHSPKIVPKAENPVELLPTPTPSVQLNTQSPEKSKGLTASVISATSAVLPFRKDTVNHFKDAFINSGNNILGVHDKFTPIVLSSRTRKESRLMKQRATIKEVFGEDRPASAPPDTCVNEIEALKNDAKLEAEPFSKNLDEILIKKEKGDLSLEQTSQISNNNNNSQQHLKDSEALANKIKKEVIEEDDEENKKLIELVIKKDPDACSETMSLDSEEAVLTGKRRSKYGKIRRKFSSGFDYIRKKKKVKKEDTDNASVERKKKKPVLAKAPESIDDIQREIKSWVLNKGIGESHLHRAARLGYVDVTAFCLDRMNCPPGPKDNAGYTPLHEACARGQLEIAKLLLKYGANVHEAAQGGIRPLHEAIENGFVEIVRLLLSYGADPTLSTYSGLTPISLASDENTRSLLKNHLTDKAGEGGPPWPFSGPAICFDPEESGYDVLADPPQSDPDPELEDIEIDVSESLLPNLYTLNGEPTTDRWVLLQDLSHLLKIKSRDALLKQISSPPSSSNLKVNFKDVIREMKMTDFLEQAHCCQFLNMGEKLNTRASKIALVKYTDRVKELLGIESVVIVSR